MGITCILGILTPEMVVLLFRPELTAAKAAQLRTGCFQVSECGPLFCCSFT